MVWSPAASSGWENNQWWSWSDRKTQRRAPWSCKQCGTVCYSKNACGNCGLKRTYADVAAGGGSWWQQPSSQQTRDPPAVQAQQSVNPVRQELAKVAAAIAAVAPFPAAPCPSPVAMDVDSSAASRASTDARIKALKAARDAIPADDEYLTAHRASLDAKITELIAQKTEARPIGARIDSARGALQRAQKRYAEASTAVSLAQEVLRHSSEEVDSLSAQLAELESALAAPHVTPPPQDVMGDVTSKLTEMVSFLRTHAGVPSEHVDDAENAAQALLHGLSQTLERADIAAAAKRRIVGKQQPPTVLEPIEKFVHVRHRGKQPMKPAKRVITDYFTKSSRARTVSVGGKSAGNSAAAGVPPERL